MRAELGRALWAELHTYAWAFPAQPSAGDLRGARAWLAEFTARLPFGCACRREWSTMVAAVPPPLHSGTAFYWWTVAAHDAVNQRLGKPLSAPAYSLAHPLCRHPYPFDPWLKTALKGLSQGFQ